MAKELKQSDIWFPSELFYDELYIASEQRRQTRSSEASGFDAFSCFSGEFPLGFALNPVCSQVEPALAEAESDEDDYLAGLTLRMTYSFLHDDDDDNDDETFFQSLSPENADASKARVIAGSPQSTLCPWSAAVKKVGGPLNCPALVPSPPISPLELEQQQQLSNKDGDAGDLLCEAAGQVMRLRFNDLDHRRSLYDCGLKSPSLKKPSPPPAVSATHKGSGTGCCTSHILSHQELQAARFRLLRQQQLSTAWGRQSEIRGGRGGGGGGYGGGGRRCGRPLGLSPAAWPPLTKPQKLQPTNGSGMRALFLNTSGVKKESAGTGVFLPRIAGNKTEPRKKQACSTVLVPARVVQALNLNLEELGGLPRVPGGFVLDHDALIGRSNAVLAHHKKNPQRQPQHFSPALAVAGHEIRLPQEWSY